jgi:hypothetical protein
VNIELKGEESDIQGEEEDTNNNQIHKNSVMQEELANLMGVGINEEDEDP